MPSVYRNLLSEMLGSRLTDSQYLVHCFASNINALLAAKLIFRSERQVVIRNAGDGESLIIEEHEPSEADLDEYGEVRFVSSRAYDPARSRDCLGRRLTCCRMLVGPDEQVRAIELDFSGKRICFSNEDDELRSGLSIESVEGGGASRLVDLR